MPLDIPTIVSIVGAALTGLGSIILGWRVANILKWVNYALVAHEQSIQQLRKITNGEPQDAPLVEGVTTHLLQIEEKIGFFLLIAGFTLLGIGMFATSAGLALRYFASV